MIREDKKQFVYMIQIVSCILYLILIFVAIAFYSGIYDFWGNTLSALGFSVSNTGADNTASMVIFSIGTSVFGFSFFPLFLALPSLFTEIKKMKTHAHIGSLFGIIGGICIIGIAFTPANLLPDPHMLFVYVGYLSISLISIFYSIALYMNEEFSNIYTIACVIFMVVWDICIILMLINSDSWITQKVGRFTTVGFFIILGYGALKLEQNLK